MLADLLSGNAPIIDLIIPGLLNLPVFELHEEQLVRATPCLHRLLRYASRTPGSVHDFDTTLIQTLGLQQSALPYARALQPHKQKTSLLFMPVHLKADMNNAIVYPVQVSDDDITLLINDLAEFFKQDCEILRLPDGSWMMTLHNCQPVLELPHFLTALGKKVTHYLEQAKTSLDWFRLFNEMQMFLYQHALNQQRMHEGQPVINSLWCWGADAYRGEKFSDRQWFSDDHALRALGELYCGHAATLDQLARSDLTSDATIVNLSLLRDLKSQHDNDLMQTLISLERECIQPLMAHSNIQLSVLTAGPENLYYRPSLRYKFWKKPLSLSRLNLQLSQRA